MLQRYCAICSFLLQIGYAEVKELLLNEEKSDNVDIFLKSSADLNLVTLQIQFNDTLLSYALGLFDGVVDKCPRLQHRLGERATIVENASFKKRLSKCSVAMKMRLNPWRRKLLVTFLAMIAKSTKLNLGLRCLCKTPAATIKDRDGPYKVQLRGLTHQKSSYVNLRFIVTRSNLCERLLSYSRRCSE